MAFPDSESLFEAIAFLLYSQPIAYTSHRLDSVFPQLPPQVPYINIDERYLNRREDPIHSELGVWAGCQVSAQPPLSVMFSPATDS